MKHSVLTYRSAGLDAKWGKSVRGAPVIFVRDPSSAFDHQKRSWWMVTKSMFEAMQRDGIVEGFRNQTLLGDIFFLPC